MREDVVTVAQSAELWIVAPAVVGSSPIGHPFYFPKNMPELPSVAWRICGVLRYS